MASASSLPRGSVFGLPVVSARMDALVGELVRRAETPAMPLLLAAADVHVITRTVAEPDYRNHLTRFDWICPDGMPLVWLLKRQHAGNVTQPEPERLSGPDIMRALWDAGQSHAHVRHFLLGGKPETLAALQKVLADAYPGAKLAGAYSPPFGTWGNEEQYHICRLIADSNATCVWVGLGAPKQERWLAGMKDALPSALYFAVGAAFDFHAGTVARAPHWMQKRGLEWLYRLCREPRRLFKRYFKYNSLFLYYLLTGRQKPDSSAASTSNTSDA